MQNPETIIVAIKFHTHGLQSTYVAVIITAHKNCLRTVTSAQGLPGAKQADGSFSVYVSTQFYSHWIPPLILPPSAGSLQLHVCPF